MQIRLVIKNTKELIQEWFFFKYSFMKIYSSRWGLFGWGSWGCFSGFLTGQVKHLLIFQGNYHHFKGKTSICFAWTGKSLCQFCKALEYLPLSHTHTQTITVSHVTGNKDYREQSLMDCDYCSGTD